jgi:hypothetical protein
MDIIVTQTIKKKELDGAVSAEARKLFAKLKVRPEIAAGISSPGLPARTTLHKVYATTEGGARRLLFFCRHAPASTPSTDRWVLLFYRDKADAVGKNMTPRNSEFARQLAKNLKAALDDLAASTAGESRFEVF